MNEVNKTVEKDQSEDMIIKYLTDSLTDSEQERFRTLISTDQSFRMELSLSIAALALSDSVAGDVI